MSGGCETFWTVCPYCFHMFEYEKMYEDCCLRCQNCRRAFHGVAVEVLKSIQSADGEKGYYHGIGFFGLKYNCASGSGNACKNDNMDDVVDISDDSDNDNCIKGDYLHGGGKEAKDEGTRVKNAEKKVVKKRNVKSVPWNSRKVMGRGFESRRSEFFMNESELKGMDFSSLEQNVNGDGNGNGDGCLEFIEKDGDVYVGIK